MANIRAKDLPDSISSFSDNDYFAADEGSSNQTKKVNKSAVKAGLGLATDRKTVVSTTSPTPDFVGQPGIDANGKTYVAISLTGTMWALTSTKLIASINYPVPDYVGQAGVDILGKKYIAISLTGTMWVSTESLVAMENLAINGSFIDNSGWTCDYASSLVASNNELAITVQNLTEYMAVAKTGFVSVLGHIYYMSGEIKSAYATETRWYIGGNLITVGTPASGSFVRYSTRTVCSYADNFAFYHKTDSLYSVGEVFYLRRALVIDLTALYGAGNEPSLAEMDALLTAKYAEKWFPAIGAFIDINDVNTLAETVASDLADFETFYEDDKKVYNVTTEVPLSAGYYYTHDLAVAAVPVAVRKLGLLITYQKESGRWATEQFIGDNISTWSTLSDWYNAEAFVPAANIVINGAFNSIDDWDAVSDTLSVNNNELSLTLVGTGAYTHIMQVADNAIIGHVYYLSAEIYPLHANDTTMNIGGASISHFTPIANQWNRLSVRMTAVDTGDGFYVGHTTATNYSISNVIKFRRCLAIDLTALYGAGNEPSLLQMDAALLARFPSTSWFDGVESLLTVSDINDKVDANTDAINSLVSTGETFTEITVAPSGTPGVDADYIGVTGIQEAIDSITDNSILNKYHILVKAGVYLADDVADWTATGTDPFTAQLSIFTTKDYVDVVGEDKHSTIIIAHLSGTNAGISYNLYNIVWHEGNSKLSGLTFIMYNGRYPIHIEGENINKTTIIEDCDIYHKGNISEALTDWSAVYPVGMGTGKNHHIIFNRVLLSDYPAFMHTNPLYNAPTIFELNECIITGGNIALYDYVLNSTVVVKCNNCVFQKGAEITYQTVSVAGQAKRNADNGTMDLYMADQDPIAFNVLSGAKSFRVISDSTGASSTVRFDETSSAFEFIVSTETVDAEFVNKYKYKQNFGYAYKDGISDLSGFAISNIDITEDVAGFSLGDRLGDCSSVNKILTITIDGTDYNVTFNTNLTSTSNADIIAIINSAISGAGVASIYVYGREYYPHFKGIQYVENGDDTYTALAGMGGVFRAYAETNRGLGRLALNTDNKIDFIWMEDTPIGAFGRVITSGELYSGYTGDGDRRHSIYEPTGGSILAGRGVGISTTNPGRFVIDQTPYVLVGVRANVVKII